MKNYNDSDYAVNKNAKGIVYRFADQTVEVTLEDYLRDNPDKTEADFDALKALSDNDYLEQDRSDYRQTWKNTPIHGVDKTTACAVPSPEVAIIERAERIERQRQQKELVDAALDKLTEVQRRRYLMYRISGMSTREIAKKEGVEQRSVMDSIEWAEKKIKKFFGNLPK